MTEIRLSVETPEVNVWVVKIRVQCGRSSLDVVEHGVEGNGAWAVWYGGTVLAGGKLTGAQHLSYEDALSWAKANVSLRENRRLAQVQLQAYYENGPS